MAYIRLDKVWRSDFCNKVSAKDRVQDMNLNQIKLKISDSFKKDKRIATKVEPNIDEDVMNKAHL